jgi:murein DD-endopeptidase MepM/ murein hydrolase activator NlpD
MQANCSPVSHFASQKYAYDFDMPIGSDIVASRAGTVLKIEEGNDDGNGCPNDNHVYIKHDDGSVAQYLHLTKDGALVAVGATVTQGATIAKSGNTGCSSDPHLHFVVFKDESYTESLPINFKNTVKNTRGLIRNNNYLAQ